MASTEELSGPSCDPEFVTVTNGDIELRVAVQGEGPLVVCVHGWPELWYSWRHQLAHFGGGPGGNYKMAAMDVRGYGGSSAPHEISAYTLRELCSDVEAVIDALGDGEPAIVLGHDWGGPIAWHTARLHPEKVRAVCGLSVPYLPVGEGDPFDIWDQAYTQQGRFFYQVYFLEEGVAEAELEADTLDALRRIYYGWSADGVDQFLKPKPVDDPLLEGLVNPDSFPAWATDDDFQVYAEAMEASGWRGPINRYRAQKLDGEQIGHLPKELPQPAAYIVGESDLVRFMVPGIDLADMAALACDDFRGTTFVPGAGHWVQQEAPEATNEAIAAFLGSL